MTKLTSLTVTAIFFLVCFSCIVSQCISRPITTGKFGEEYWLKHPWLLADAPMGFKWPMPEKQWPYAQGPMPHKGWKHWHLAYSPFPCPWWPNKEDLALAADQIAPPPALAP